MKTNGKRTRQSPSVERQIALALVAVLDGIPDETISTLSGPVIEARKVLKACGYEDLESIPIRVARIEGQIEEALKTKNYDALPRLGQEMKRAEKGLPPLTVEKKPRKPRTPKTAAAEPAEKKSRKKKSKDEPAPLPVGQASYKCIYPGCAWAGPAPADLVCPVCGTEVVADGKSTVA